MTTIQLRRATASSWTSIDPILALGEVGVETDTLRLKVGDGVSLWSALPYFVSDWDDVTNRPTELVAGGGQVNGFATLDGNGKVPVAQLPASLMQYQGVWDADTNSPSLVDGTGNVGDVYRITVAGSRNLGSGAIDFAVGDYVIYNSSLVWEKSDTTDAVATVAGRTGNVTLSASDVSGVVATGGALGTPTSGDVSACVGQVADMSIVAFGATTARATGTGDFPFGVKLQRAITFTSVTFRAATADASGNLVVELRKNGSAVSGTSTTIAAANQVAGGTSTGTWSFAAGDILAVQVTAVGSSPGKGLVADIKGLTA